jgi:enoyl-CoA hydratase/carnithine racemase
MAAQTETFKEGHVGWIVLARPEKMNAVTSISLEEMRGALADHLEDPSVRTIVLTGQGKGFCAGSDLLGIAPGKDTLDFLTEFGQACLELENSPKPVIAAVNGVAMAGGMEMLLACDIVLAADGAKLGDGHAKFAMIPGAGASFRLPRRVGESMARRLLLTGELLEAQAFLNSGFVTKIVPAEALRAEAQAMAEAIGGTSPICLKSYKALLSENRSRDAVDAVRAEAMAIMEYSESFDFKEGLAAFSEKRKPQFKGV